MVSQITVYQNTINFTPLVLQQYLTAKSLAGDIMQMCNVNVDLRAVAIREI